MFYGICFDWSILIALPRGRLSAAGFSGRGYDEIAVSRRPERREPDAGAHGLRRSFVTQHRSQLKILAFDFVLRYFTGPFPAQYLSRVVVHPILDCSDLRGLHLVKIRTLGKESSDHAVMILIASFLPCRIAVTVVDMKPCSASDAPDQLLILQELASIVCGDAAELLPKLWRPALQPVNGPADRLRSPIRQLHNDLLSAPALGQREQHSLGATASNDQIHLPMSAL